MEHKTVNKLPLVLIGGFEARRANRFDCLMRLGFSKK